MGFASFRTCLKMGQHSVQKFAPILTKHRKITIAPFEMFFTYPERRKSLFSRKSISGP